MNYSSVTCYNFKRKEFKVLSCCHAVDVPGIRMLLNGLFLERKKEGKKEEKEKDKIKNRRMKERKRK